MIAVQAISAPAYTIEWEVSAPSLMVGTDAITDITELLDGTVCVLTRDASTPGVLLLNSEGTKLSSLWHVDEVGSYETEIGGGLTKEAFSIIYDYQNFYLFGLSKDVLSATKIDIHPYTSLGARGQYNRSTSYFYAYDQNLLTVKKIRITSFSETVVGDVSMGLNDQNFVVSWGSKKGATYQIQTSTNMTEWLSVDGEFAGNGNTLTWANSLTNSHTFYRVIEK